MALHQGFKSLLKTGPIADFDDGQPGVVIRLQSRLGGDQGHLVVRLQKAFRNHLAQMASGMIGDGANPINSFPGAP